MKGLFRTVRSRTTAAFVLMLFAVAALGAQDYQVDREELQSFGDQSIKFINYVGPHEFINTLDQIRGIGRALGVPVDPGTSGRSDVGGRYRILHIVSPEIPTGLDADVFILESGAAVDHIRNLRLILAGYLEEARRILAAAGNGVSGSGIQDPSLTDAFEALRWFPLPGEIVRELQGSRATARSRMIRSSVFTNRKIPTERTPIKGPTR